MTRHYKLLYVLLSVLILSACFSTLSGKELCTKKPKGDFRVVTYNMNWGEDGLSITSPKKTLAVLKKISADVVVLQEVTPFWFNALKANLSSVYPYMAFMEDTHAGGMAYISKYPVNNVRYVKPPVEGEWHLGIIMDVNSPLGQLQILNLHLTPPLISKLNPSFNLGPFFSSCQIREKEIEYFYNLIDPNKPTIIAGDFNEGDNGLVSYFLNYRGFRDAPSPSEYSWKWKVGMFTAKRKLDHVFYNSYFKLDKVQIIHDGDSDHFPIVVDLNV